jgi:branched-chain amino acid transport system ATP-binding protein
VTEPDERDVLLRGRGLTRRWGGLVAVSDVSIELSRGSVHAVIGTNGAGKSTLVGMLAGEIRPTSGTVELMGRDVTSWPQPRRARAGLGRTFQRSTLHPGFTVLENCRLAAQARVQRPWRIWERADRCAASLAAARHAAARAGLGDLLERTAGSLSHGQRRQLEIATCIATAPRVLLLDEPLAGMGAEETDRMLGLLETLKADHAILLVEHDMDAVFRTADRVTVMVDGSVLASGTAAEVRALSVVQAAYLGGDAPAPAPAPAPAQAQAREHPVDSHEPDQG